MFNEMHDEEHDCRETEEWTTDGAFPQPRQTGFAYCQQACGLSTEETMTYLGLSRSSVEKKRSGERSMSSEEAAAFSSLWHDIRAFRIRDLPAGAVEMAYATLILTGRRAPEQKSRGRKRLVPLDPAVETETKRQRNLAAMAEAIAGIAAKREETKAERKANRQAELDALMSAVRRPEGEA